MPIDHYENFPVASLLLPARLRSAVEVIYAFARSADDIADEGDASPNARLAALTAYECALDRIENRQPAQSPLFSALTQVVQHRRLPLAPLRALLYAFKQDIVTTRYASFDALLDYCQHSANPVGHLMLHLYDATTPQNTRDSNAICSALQLINFWQDVAIDWKKNRIYLPQEDLIRFNVSEKQLSNADVNDAWRALMHFEVARTRALLWSGATLAHRLPGRLGWELRLVIQGGLRILERLDSVGYDMFHQRPTLGKIDWLYIGWRALWMKNSANW